MKSGCANRHNSYKTVATFDAPVGNIKIAPLSKDTYAFAISGQQTPDGTLFNPENAVKPHSTAKVYDHLFVRQWDSYVTENKNSIWFGTLKKSGSKYLLSKLINALKNNSGGKETLALESPVPPFGGGDNFDISKSGLVFIAKDPKLDPANHTKTDLYFIPLDFGESEATTPQIISTGQLRGYCGCPCFSPDSKSLAFTRMKNDKYESDKTRLLVLPDINDLNNVQEFWTSSDGEGSWDRSPSSILWSQDGKTLYITAEENGRVKLFSTPSNPTKAAASLPKELTTSGAVSALFPLAKDSSSLFITSATLVDSSIYSILAPSSIPSQASSIQTISSVSKSGKTFGLHPSQVSEICFPGADDSYDVHAWVMVPSNFSKEKKYPLAYLIHGGPQGAWTDSWSTRWNPAVFAEQGYVVVTPNPTGSTGYGMALQNGIRNQWGGRPYEDIVKGFEYIEKELDFVDTTRAVALGASYGGYMMNWIQGHPLGRKFKALVTHDGVFSTLNQYSSEELFFPQHDFAGTLWEHRENYERWDPARFTKEWATPHLVIHNELDYRLPISEGLAVFNVLKSKGVPARFLTFPDEVRIPHTPVATAHHLSFAGNMNSTG